MQGMADYPSSVHYVWFLTGLYLCAARTFLEGPFRRTLFFLGILEGMQLILFGMLAVAAALAPGQPWPTLEGETLAGPRLRLPDAAAGRPALIVFTFSREAGGAAKPWCTKLVQEFGVERVYQVAMLEKAPRLVRGLIRRGMRGDVPTAWHARTILLYEGDADWRAKVGLRQENAPVVVLLREGRVVGMLNEVFSEAAYQKLRAYAV